MEQAVAQLHEVFHVESADAVRAISNLANAQARLCCTRRTQH